MNGYQKASRYIYGVTWRNGQLWNSQQWWRSAAYWRHTYESQGWQLLISYLLAQNISFFACCSAVMEVGFINISPLPTGKALNVVIREGAGGMQEEKGVSVPCSGVPWSPDSCRGQFRQHLASPLKCCARSQFLKLKGTHSIQQLPRSFAWWLQSRVLLAKSRPMNKFCLHSLGNFTVSPEAWHCLWMAFPSTQRTDF